MVVGLCGGMSLFVAKWGVKGLLKYFIFWGIIVFVVLTLLIAVGVTCMSVFIVESVGVRLYGYTMPNVGGGVFRFGRNDFISGNDTDAGMCGGGGAYTSVP